MRVIGVGSPFGADRLGLLAAARLRSDPRLPPGVEVRVRDRPGAALIADLTDVDAVLLLDAVAGGVPGRLVRLDRRALLAGARPLSSHALGVAEAVALAEALGRLPGRLLLLGLETGPGGGLRLDEGTLEAFSAQAVGALREMGASTPG